MKKYNMHDIMTRAWALVHKTGKTISECLKIAWHNAKVLLNAKTESGANETVHTWYGWKSRGMDVVHGSKCLFKVTVLDPKTKSGTKTLSYFGESQVVPVEC